MVRITIDDKLKEKLQAADGVVELCDVSGQVIGRATLKTTSPIDWETLFPALTEEVYQQRINSPEAGLSTEELKAKLRELA